MSRSNSRTSNRNKEDKSPPETWDEKLIRSLLPWKTEIAGVLLILAAGITMLAGVGLTGAPLLDAWARLLNQLMGWGIVPLSLMVALVGLYLILRRAELPFQISTGQVLGLELILLTWLATSHMVIGDGLRGALAGQGGGLVGWALSDPLLDFVGPILTMLVLAAIFSVGLSLCFKIGWSDLIESLNRLSLRFQVWSNELEIDIAERRASGTDGPQEQSGEEAAGGEPHDADDSGLIVIEADALPNEPNRRESGSDLPSLELLEEGSVSEMPPEEVALKSRIIEETLLDFGLPASVTEIRTGPAVTQFGVQPGYIERKGADGTVKQQKVRVGQISALQKDLALALTVTRLRIQAPVPGRGIVGVEVPNAEASVVRLRPLMESDVFQKIQRPLAVALGLGVTGSPVAADLGKLPHLLIAGTTGSGKSVCLNSLITCLILNNSPSKLRMIMIDPKRVELIRFNGTPHLIGKVEVAGDRVIAVLRWLTGEMDRRYELFANAGAKHLDDYNRQIVSPRRSTSGDQLPNIVIFIDELADLMATNAGEVERTLCRLAQMARATGIHLVVATQRPSTDVITGLIKANFPARASFMVASGVDSRVILDTGGAEHLMGKGDMLYLPPDASVPQRIQGCFVNDREVEAVVNYWQQQAPIDENEEKIEEPAAPWEGLIAREVFIGERDEMLEQAIALARKNDRISTSLIQRKLRVGYPRAARLMESLHEMGLVEDQKEGGKTRRSYVQEGDDPLASAIGEPE